jgi:tetratricopeptide (TPR) repeat protein
MQNSRSGHLFWGIAWLCLFLASRSTGWVQESPSPDIPTQRAEDISAVTSEQSSVWPEEMLLHPASTSKEYISALSAYIGYDFERAEKLLLGIVEKYPDFYLGWHYLALCSTHKPDLAEARDRWLKVFELTDKFEVAYYDLALCYIAMGDVERAKALLEQGLALFPGNGHLHFNLGVIFGYEQNWKGAEEQYRLALECLPNHPQTLYNLALIVETDDLDEAIELWKKYLDSAKDIAGESLYIPQAQLHLDKLIDERIYRDLKESGGK